MDWFPKPLIYPLLDACHPRVMVEVGIDVSAVTSPLLDWAQANGAVLHAIDPDPALSLERLLAERRENLRFHRQRSLDVLDDIGGVDLALLDGDHNWYTVINELRALERRARADGRDAPAVVVHGTGWPYGRRDVYCEPEAIPEAYRQPHARRGVVPGQAELGAGLNDHLENALLEGTPANGVLTAVEDFVAESDGSWRSFPVPGLGGFEILVSATTLGASAGLREWLDRLDSPAFLRARCEAIEQARIESERKRAGLLRRLAETQLKQVMRSPDPHETVVLKRRVRTLTEQVRELSEELDRVDELEEQLRVLTLHRDARSDDARSSDDAPSERDAWRTLLDSYLPILEGALPCEDERDPLSEPCPLDILGVLSPAGAEQEPGAPSVDVIVCVHDALADVRACLWSLLAKTGRRFRLIIVNDGSGAHARRFLRAFAGRYPAVTLIERERPPHGYTLAANRGLEASGGDYAVLLNSDTVLSSGWLGRLIAHGEAHEEVGILGPLSNAASHQSVPAVRDGGAWAANALPDWLTVDGMGLIVERGLPRSDARLPFLNGFCYAIKRSVLDAVGLLDEERFPTGYCEENDYSQRARDAGFALAVVDDAYVHHAKSRSFGDSRAELAERNYQGFLDKHGRPRIEQLVSEMEADQTLEPARAAVAEWSAAPEAIAPLLAAPGRAPLSVVFLLPGLAHGGSGGSHSIYQEVKGLRRLGVPARILLPRWDGERAAEVYGDAAEVFQTFTDVEDLLEKTIDADVISATHHKSVATLSAVRSRREDFLPAYYVQDYEPFFTAPYLAEEAIASYTALEDMLLFAKSHWLCNVVAERHGLFVEKVQASLDRELFTPSASAGESAPTPAPDPRQSGQLRVLAMVRPRTARRQPLGTVAVLERLREQFGPAVKVSTFGCYADELREILPGRDDVLERHLGMLSRSQVAGRLRETDVFLDMSVYQAFGRTALEAMACGATAVVPEVGGAWEFVEHARNALAVDTFGPSAALAALGALATDRELLRRLKQGALATAERYSIERAALSEYLAFERAHRARFGSSAQRPGGVPALLTRR